MQRVAEPETFRAEENGSPYTVTTPDMDANRGASNILWIVSRRAAPNWQLTLRGMILDGVVVRRRQKRWRFLFSR